jgi:peptide/nickel transport system permease protein
MGKYILQRVLMAIPLLFFISIILFVIMNSIGDPLAIQMSMTRPPTGAELEIQRRRMGLDKPIYLQYVYWMIGNDWTLVDADGDGTTSENIYGRRKGILRGDLGTSIITHQPAQDRITERLPNTLLLMLPTYSVTLLIALALGIFSALRKYTLWDNALTTIAFVFYSMPVFFVSLGMIYVFAVAFRRWGLPYTPIAGMYEVGEAKTLGNLIRHMILPVSSLALISSAFYSRYVRASVLEVMNRDYVRTARAKGLREPYVFGVHVLKNAALPLITIVGLDLPFLLGGAIVTERIFAWPGMGLLFIESLGRSDYPVLMGILMFIAVAVVVFQLITDVIYSLIDPRVRLTQ